VKRAALAGAFIGAVLLFGARPLHSQMRLQSVLFAAGFSTPVAIVQDPTNRAVQVVVEQS
jgi:hypothetical protein